MVYLTVMQSPMYHQMTLEEFLFQTETAPALVTANTANTRTYQLDRISYPLRQKLGLDVVKLIRCLRDFNASTEVLRSADRHSLYNTFYIPKAHGGFRRIDAPNDDLMNALRTLKTLFETEFHALYHTSAFAYVRHRSTIDAVKRHQQNESRWFGKYDLHNFFGSTTLPFVMNMFSMIYPFSEVVQNPHGREELERALELAFLDGVLPQGTPISPLITNVMMIPVDYKLANSFRDFQRQRFVYTRYADDFLVSSRYTFSYRAVENHIVETLSSFGAPFSINREKTRYGSSAGRNWNLGVMLNEHNEITVGYQNKRRFQAALTSFVRDTQAGNLWPLEEVQRLEGMRNYYHMVEGDKITQLVSYVSQKMGVDIPAMMKQQLRVV